MLAGRIHFAKRDRLARRHEHRIIAKPAFAPRWPDQLAVHFAFEDFLVAIRPDDRQGADEFR